MVAAAVRIHAAGTDKKAKKPLLERAVRVEPTLPNQRRDAKSERTHAFRDVTDPRSQRLCATSHAE
jgi:hypothetical protein